MRRFLKTRVLLPVVILLIAGLSLAAIYFADTSTSCYTFLGLAHYINGGIADRSQQDLPGSVASFDCAARIAPASWEVYYERGISYLYMYMYGQADADLGRALDLASREESASEILPGIYWHQGLMYYFGRRYQQASDELEQAIQVEPEYWPAYLVQGWIYTDLEQYEQAITSTTIIIDGEADNISRASALADRSFAYRALGQDEQADADLSRALELNPQIAEAYVSGGYVLLFADPERSIRSFSQAIEMNPNLASVYYWRAEASSRVNDDLDSEERDLLRAIELAPDWPAPYYQLGEIFTLHGREDEALELYRQYLAQVGDDPNPMIVERFRRLEERIESGS